MRITFIQKNDTITIYEGLDPTIVDQMEADGFLDGHNISIDFDDMFDYCIRIGDYGYDSLFMSMVQNQRMNEIIRDEWDLMPDEIHWIDALIDFNKDLHHRMPYYIGDNILAYLDRDASRLYVTTNKNYKYRFTSNLLVSTDERGNRLEKPLEELAEAIGGRNLEIRMSKECSKEVSDKIWALIKGDNLALYLDKVDYLINVENGNIIDKEDFSEDANSYIHIGEGKFKRENFCFQALKEVKCF